MDDQNKMAAAVGAVMAYIKSEEEAVCMQAAAAGAAQAAAVAAPAPPMNLWGASGRQDMMQMRNLMQMKTFNRLR